MCPTDRSPVSRRGVLLVISHSLARTPNRRLISRTDKEDHMAQATPGSNYTVQQGDTLSGIAQQAYGDGNQYQVIANANHISDPNVIYSGQVLFIPVLSSASPTPGSNYTVQQGDTLSGIAQQAYGDGNQWQKIYDYPANKQVIGPDPNLIRPGEVLFIPPLSSTSPTPGSNYTVQQGDTLSGIAQRAYGDGNQWQKIYDYPA